MRTYTLGLVLLGAALCAPFSNAVAADKEDAVKPVSAELQAFRDAFVADFDRIGLNSAPGDAMMLRILVESAQCRRGVEVGTATGYGAMVMGLGFERNGGELITIDIDHDMVVAAQANLEKMQLSDVVTVVEGDAIEVCKELEGEFDFVYLDAAKSQYLDYFEALEPKLAPGAVIVADNVIKSAKAMANFLERIESDPAYLKVTIRASDLKNDGMMVIHKLR